MKLKKHIKFKDGNQVWRILISPAEKLIIETRNIEKKEAFFACYNLIDSKKIFKSFQLDEKYWIGIEDLYEDLILFHKFTKPDMPGHKSIIAYDTAGKKFLWENPGYSFLFLYLDKIYCYSQRFESRNYYTLDPRSGKLIEELGNDPLRINELKYSAEALKDYSGYIFPQIYTTDVIPGINLLEIINSDSIRGNIEFVKKGEYIFANYHHNIAGILLENIFIVYDVAHERTVHNEIINSAVNSYVPDSFFIYKGYLVLLKEKSEVIVYKLD